MSRHTNTRSASNHADDLRAQFSSIQANTPVTDIPSLPTPHLVSPVKQQHFPAQLKFSNHTHPQVQNQSQGDSPGRNENQSYVLSPTHSTNARSISSSSSSLPTDTPTKHSNRNAFAASTHSSSTSHTGRKPPPNGAEMNNNGSYSADTNGSYSQQRPYNERTISNRSNGSTGAMRYPQQQTPQHHQHQQQQTPQHHQHQQQQTPQHHQYHQQQTPQHHQYHQQQTPQHHQYQQQLMGQSQPQSSTPAFNTQKSPVEGSFSELQNERHVSNGASGHGNLQNLSTQSLHLQQKRDQELHYQSRMQQQQRLHSQPNVPSPTNYMNRPPQKNYYQKVSSSKSNAQPPPINTQLNTNVFQNQQQTHLNNLKSEDPSYIESPLGLRIPSTPKNAIPPVPRALPENSQGQSVDIYKTQGLLPGKSFAVTQTTGHENASKSNTKTTVEQYKRSPSLSNDVSSKATQKSYQSQDQLQSSPVQNNQTQSSNRKSPIVRQSINFFKSARNFSTSSIGQLDSPVAQGHSSFKEMEKYHLPAKQATTSGRIIPQKIDYSSPEILKKSRSLSTLTKRVASNTSLRSTAEKNRYVSTTSLTSTLMTSSPSIKKRYIYPAILSEVAGAFLHEIKLSCHFKYGIEYRNSFSGSEAIEVICRITKIRDRNLAIILGRALDAQGLFHDVTYEHRLRDNKSEIYLISDEFLYDQSENVRRQHSVSSTLNNNDEYSMSISASSLTYTNERSSIDKQISSVFVLLTECYSPTCTRDKLCYSVSCPRRFEQKMRAEMQTNSLVRSDSHVSFTQDDQKQYWQLTVPKSLLETLDKREIKRQECIFETINSEKTFIKDLEYIREFWIRPLSETKIIKDKERDQFIRNVFHNINEIWDINHKFAEALVRRQQKSPIVDSIADIFLDFIPQLTPFITYGAGQVIGKYEFDRQRRHNPLLRRFIEDTAKREESKRLDLSSFLSKPTTRPARYPLLLKSIRDHTDPESPDYKKLGDAIELLQKMLTKINFETGKQSDKMNLFQIRQKLLFKPGELFDLKLSADNRKIIYQCVLKKKGYQEKEKQGEIHVYLFDHCLLFIKLVYSSKREVYKVYQRPIPLPLLFFSTSENPPTIKAIRKAATRNGSAPSQLGISSASSFPSLNSTVAKSPISFKYIGIRGYELTLYGTPATQKILASKIEAQTKKILADNDVYTLTPLCSNFFDLQNKINCVFPFDGGRKILYGTDLGVYVGDRTAANSAIKKVISKVNIIQVEIIQEYQIFVALCDKKLLFWPASVLNGGDPSKNAKLGKELMNHTSFFNIGVCDGRMLLCAAKSTSNIVRIFEPIDPIQQKKQKKKFINNKEDLHFNSEPVSINFLKTKLCVGCSSGFQIVSLVNNSMEELLDPADTSLEFATGKEGLKPLSIDRINSDFLLSYSNFSFFINHNGWRVRPKWLIEWEGVPHSFALWYPYLLAFSDNFIEIRSVQNAELLRIIVGENIRFLHASSQEILYAYENDRGYDVVASLDFWDKSMKNGRSRNNTIVTPNP